MTIMVSTAQHPGFEASDSPMITLVKLSHFYGANPDFILAGGGNTSVKNNDRLFVKGSGTSLANITEEGFVELDRKPLQDLLDGEVPKDIDEREARFKTVIMGARLHPERGQRPSVEAVLHHLLPGKFVVHSHATLANALTCCTHGEAIAKEIFGEKIIWIPYVDPGFLLAKTLYWALKDYQKKTGREKPVAVFMQNHGLIVSGDTPDEIIKATDEVIHTIQARLDKTPGEFVFGEWTQKDEATTRKLVSIIAPALRGLLAREESLKVVTFDNSKTIIDLIGGGEGKGIATGGPLTPDQIVYCKAFPMWFEATGSETTEELVAKLGQAVVEHEQKTGFPPHVVLVKDLGIFAVGDDFTAAHIVRLVYTDAVKVMSGAKRLGGVKYMGNREREFIEHWEVESYRRKVAAGAGGRGRAAGKIAFVTGAAQGFGLEIAEQLAANGAHVVLADMNVQGSEKAAREINVKLPGKALGLAINVTDADSIENAIYLTVKTFGGFDVFVSNAGVLKAESVKTQAAKDFDFVTSVNYRGYFLCVQKSVPTLAIQHLAKPDYWSDIIQINSKSGLQGSNKNGAYAGSKFGSIGLTQSFALELVTDGIKVNSICPGNFLDGPLWSNPVNGLFVQYLKTGKVPGAKTIEDVKKFYESKVPMNRGCRPVDVLRAILYVMDQQYETGQAIPVTGGQVMLT
jgi:rhamnose utilization protein RhaD (predicted bifunctional aldolase and dehydrogenase)/NAD(P)-dependent dehydrogenase (short-subunit alcohol dehydrogenase family)